MDVTTIKIPLGMPSEQRGLPAAPTGNVRVWLSRAELLTLAAKIAAQADELRRLGDARGAARYDWRAAELRGLPSQTTTPSA